MTRQDSYKMNKLPKTIKAANTVAFKLALRAQIRPH